MSVSLEWCAGFFEGEGNATIRRYDSKTGKNPFPALQLAQVDREPLDLFCETVGGGRVYGPYGPYQNNKKAYYQWSVQGRAALPIAEKLIPLLIIKRAQLEAMVREMEMFYESN